MVRRAPGLTFLARIPLEDGMRWLWLILVGYGFAMLLLASQALVPRRAAAPLTVQEARR